MLFVQGWIPPLDQIALLIESRLFSGWCDVGRNVRRPLVVQRQPSAHDPECGRSDLPLSKVQWHEVAVGQLFQLGEA
jgi:hypothetical protein